MYICMYVNVYTLYTFYEFLFIFGRVALTVSMSVSAVIKIPPTKLCRNQSPRRMGSPCVYFSLFPCVYS